MTGLAAGIDIGGSGVKGAIVDLNTGDLTTENIRIETPQPATPDAVALTVRQVLTELGVTPDIPVGVAFPAPIIHGVVPFIANLDESWAGLNVHDLMEKHLGRPITALNDADAAGLAEIAYGAAQNVDGLVIVTTQGTGIGSAMVMDGVLIPNTELGHLEIDGHDAEKRASAGQKTLQELSWEEWAQRLQRYYSHVEMLFAPDLFVVGGGVSQNHDKFMPLLDLKTPMVPAQLFNTAGIVGAAYYAARQAAKA